MRTIYIMEYHLLDSLNRQKSSSLAGVYRTLEDAEEAKVSLITKHADEKLSFSINPYEMWP